MRLSRATVFLLPALACLLAAGCASVRFPPEPPAAPLADGLDGDAVFARTLAAHGGDLRAYPGDINLSTDGRWFALIQRIQPLVSDSGFRIRSEERYRPRDGLYAVSHSGPQGSKHVVRSRDGLAVSYNGVRETDPAKLRATAMTNDAFRMFHFGPSFFLDPRPVDLPLRLVAHRVHGTVFRKGEHVADFCRVAQRIAEGLEHRVLGQPVLDDRVDSGEQGGQAHLALGGRIHDQGGGTLEGGDVEG